MPQETASGSTPIKCLTCHSCSTPLQGAFCHVCGIKAQCLPLTLPDMWQDFSERVLHIEKSLKRTVGHLCWQPAVVFKAFLQGQRLRYTHPLPFLVAIATLSVLLGHLYGEPYFEAYRAQLLQQVSGSLPPARSALYAQLNVWLSLSMPYWMLIFTLPTAGLMRLLFPQRGFTIAEAWAVGLYGVAMAMLLGLLLSSLGQWAQVPLAMLQTITDATLLLLTIAYYLAWLGHRPWTLLRVVVACLFGFALMNQLQELLVYRIAAWLPGIQ
ncbi:DUF3667 domain-containing protein [Paucibacter sp. B2R-40]|uniref:DUF3667 domain-containing protein n=1 Tax=Paucibacter sp. B2R-40 TaxID=2893554 RepID=UPI0021E42941|nr:DUF3667 domain-containing protein [Paucibacter sp. B2R-40]MCV2352789.1 DUF3667 domain-containing protein [Paucibacter sp. B2R-40]